MQLTVASYAEERRLNTMLKPYEVIVTYRLCALDETDATSQVLTNRIEPETLDVSDLPTRPTPEVTIPAF